jgi:hypothetical protein
VDFWGKKRKASKELLELAEQAATSNLNVIMHIPAAYVTLVLRSIVQVEKANVLRLSSATLKRIMETYAGKPLTLPYTDIEMTPKKLEEVVTDALKFRDDLEKYPNSLEILLHPTGKQFLTLIQEVRKSAVS